MIKHSFKFLPISAVLFFTSLLVFVGCVTTPPTKVEPAVSKMTTVTVPSLVPVENYPQSVEKDRVRITLEPYEFQVGQAIRVECNRQPQLLIVNDQYNFKVTGAPVYKITPDKMRFKIRINNNLDHVLRLAGSVVVFQVNNRSVAIDQSGYADFLNGVILPRQEVELEIAGPDVHSLSEDNNVALLIYDVVTQTDSAGNATQRSSFEWFYQVKETSKEIPYTIKEKTFSMNLTQANSYCGSVVSSDAW